MTDPIKTYHDVRLSETAKALEHNGFTVFIAEDAAEAGSLVMEKITGELQPKSVSWGGSMTLAATGIMDAVKSLEGVEVLDTADKTITPEAMYERRRRSLLVDLFFTGSNAVTVCGKLVNLDMIGNRTSAIGFGPRHVVVLAGRNKICETVESAKRRIKEYAAPVNAMRLHKKTPCVKTGRCHDCASPDRICNVWTVSEKSFPKGRVIVVLINEDLGF